MLKNPKLLLLALSSVLVCSACARVSLSGSGHGGNASTPAMPGGFSLPSFNLGNSAPPLDGEWHLTFVYNGEEHESTIHFKQNGKQLSGDGADDNGLSFMIINGSVDGDKVHFTKKYADSDPTKVPVEYSGQLTYNNDADFKGWSLGGHYKANIGGQPVDDKWVAISAAAEKEAAQEQGQSPPAPAPAPEQQSQQPPEQQAQSGDGAEQTGEIPDNIAGMYTARYDYNFKRVDTRLWLKQDGEKLSGDGTDTNTGEYFVVSKGFCRPPRVLLTCHYEKGKHAASTRDITIRATISPGPMLKGETQFGSPWTANFVR